MGVSSSSPRSTSATFLLGPVGFPCWVPSVIQKPKGLPLPVPYPPALPGYCPPSPPGTNCQGSTSICSGNSLQRAAGGGGGEGGGAGTTHAAPPSGGRSFPHIPCGRYSPLGGPIHPEADGEDTQRPWLVFLTSQVLQGHPTHPLTMWVLT